MVRASSRQAGTFGNIALGLPHHVLINSSMHLRFHRQIKEAYETLYDPILRQQYDLTGMKEVHPKHEMPPFVVQCCA